MHNYHIVRVDLLSIRISIRIISIRIISIRISKHRVEHASKGIKGISIKLYQNVYVNIAV